MIAIIINSLIILLSASTISYMDRFCKRHKYEAINRIRYFALGGAIMGGAFANIMMVLTYGSVACYFFYAIDRFLRILFVGELVLNAENVIEVPGNVISKFVTFITYSSTAIYFLDTVMNRGKLKLSLYGVYSPPLYPLHRFVYFIIYALYIVLFLTFIIFKVTSLVKKREKFELLLLGFSFGFCAVGFLMELFVFIYVENTYIPSIIFNFISLVFMFHLIAYHRSIMLCRADYENELMPNKKDVIFILDDELKVAFINKRAEVMSIIVQDSYIGKSIDEIFEFTPENYEEILNPEERAPFGSSAEYRHLNKHVNIVFDHRYDRYGDIFSSCVTLYNMEPKEMLPDTDEEFKTPLDEIKKMYEETRQLISGKKILIVDEDIAFLNDLQNHFEPYDVKVTRSIGGRAALDIIRDEDFDMAFIADGMSQYSAFEVSRQIRKRNEERKKELPLILVTGADINQIFMEMLDAGFTDYISKPIQPIQLNSSLTRWLWKKREK